MELKQAAAELQSTYLAYRSLVSAAIPGKGGEPGSRFLLLTEHRADSTQRAMAARIAGTATLWSVESGDTAKRALRSGACDFLVSSLDEALRILKNEIRRQAPVTVCLHSLPQAVLAECVERGVQPDLMEEPCAVLESRGAMPVRWHTALRAQEQGVCWLLNGDLIAQVALDRIARNVIGEERDDRTQWLASSPAVLGRSRQRFRFLPMTVAEENCLRESTARLPVTFQILA